MAHGVAVHANPPDTLFTSMISNVLAICQGNLCRSPMAAALLERATADARIRSAGLDAVVGHPPPQEAMLVMAEIGIDIASHRAVQVSRQLCIEADLVLVMSADQSREITQRYPFARGKVFLLSGSDRVDVADPFGRSVESFRDCREAIGAGIAFWLRKIVPAHSAATQRMALNRMHLPTFQPTLTVSPGEPS